MQFWAVRTFAPLVVCGVALYAADVWKTKDPSIWTSEDIQKVLTDSPWAKTVNVKMEASGQGGGMGRGGGGGWGGGGMGMPRIGGMGMPGGGMGGGRRGGRMPQQSVTATIRWDSATPIKEALLKSKPASEQKASSEDAAKTSDPSLKNYVITVIGLRTGMRQYSRGTSDTGAGSDDSRQRKRDPEAVREELMESTRLTPKGKRAILPNDVKIDTEESSREIHFFFPREAAIDRDDKEVTFETQLGRMKLEKKFTLKDMVFQGKLAL
ncbi:MAG TPA: hypothetical protein VKV15_14650 [Bryobacteraceae bacterium]|nr:hypothetical protein [Bryobacteraceae bacterium]